MTAVSPNQIQGLLDRVRRRNYSNYLVSLKMIKLRGFKDANIRFDFPVTALVGPNGAGKTTVLGAAGLIYADVPPRRFFARGGTYDSSMSGWKVEYDVISSGTQLPRTASYTDASTDVTRLKWNRSAVNRPVKVIGVGRTLPLTERTDVSRFASGTFVGVAESAFTANVVEAVERILGKDAADYLQVHADKNGKFSILARRPSSPTDIGYSEFHFGAGEASIIRIVSEIESVEDQALILIEEVENGLHPVATQRLVEYFMMVARRKSCQIIFTTHSNHALSPLPGDAVWAASRGELLQGKLDVESLRALTGEIDARLAIFTEDNFGSLAAEVSLRRYNDLTGGGIDLKSVQIHALGGASAARDQALHNNNNNPARRFKAISFLDGDKRSEDGYDNSDPKYFCDASPFMTYFAGTDDPEKVVMDDIERLISADGRSLSKLALALQMETSQTDRVSTAVRAAQLGNVDPHEIFREIGEDLDFLEKGVTARAFVSTWANSSEDNVRAIWDPVAAHLPRLSDRE